jgi:branched-chain amino acid transport system ATP-binding protein
VLLETHGLTMDFGGVRAVGDLNLRLDTGDLTALIGPNGAGKTTVFNLLSGLYRPTAGTIRFDGKSIERLKPWRITRLGMARTFQNIRLFGNLSALDNVRIALHGHVRYTVAEALLHCTPRFVREEAAVLAEAEALLARCGLADVAHQEAGSLPYGQQRRLEIARALATHPRLLLLDEPAAGMNPQETAQLVELLRALHRDLSLTILLIEHDMKLVMTLCAHIYVLEYGALIAEGTPEAIRTDPLVIEAYMGEKVGDAERV